MTISRTPAGVPTGGQFAVRSHTEADLELGVPEPIPELTSPPLHDQNLYAAAGSYADRQLGEMSVDEKHKAMTGFTDTHGFAEWHCAHGAQRGLSMPESHAFSPPPTRSAPSHSRSQLATLSPGNRQSLTPVSAPT